MSRARRAAHPADLSASGAPRPSKHHCFEHGSLSVVARPPTVGPESGGRMDPAGAAGRQVCRDAEKQRHAEERQRVEPVDLELQLAQQEGRDDSERLPERAAEDHRSRPPATSSRTTRGHRRRAPCGCRFRASAGRRGSLTTPSRPTAASASASTPKADRTEAERATGAAASAPSGGRSSSSRGPAGRDPARDRRSGVRARSAPGRWTSSLRSSATA